MRFHPPISRVCRTGILPRELVAGQVYELRFLADRLSVFRRDSLTALAEFSYADAQAVEVAGPAG